MSMQQNRILNATALGSLLVLVVAGPAHAVDGVIEINQARVKAGGGHFPFMITQPGSYRLTSNLDVTETAARMTGVAAENTTAIQVTADDVTIDLNGFMIKGPCVLPLSGIAPCSPTGSGKGIDASAQTGVAVMNGILRGMGSSGVFLGPQSQAEKVRALSNGFRGIQADTVANCTANDNGDTGITGMSVATCVASRNGNIGIGATTVTGCTADGNSINITANGIKCHNSCGGTLCPGPCP
jgi:hypothetical protein